MISKSSADFIEGLVKNAEDKGAKLLQPYKREGNLIWPVLVDNVTKVRSVLCIYWHADVVCLHLWIVFDIISINLIFVPSVCVTMYSGSSVNGSM